MENHISKRGIPIMSVGTPTARAKIDLHIPAPRSFLAYSDHCSSKIWAAFCVAKTGMKNPHRPSVQGLKFIAQHSLVLPNRLQQAFGRRLWLLAQMKHNTAAHAALRVKVIEDRSHQTFAL